MSQKLTGAEIKGLFAGRTYTCEGHDGTYIAYYPNADTVVLKFTDLDGQSVRLRGTLRYESDAICYTWNRPEWKSECFDVWHEGDGVRTVKRAESAHPDECIGKVLDGNPRKL